MLVMGFYFGTWRASVLRPEILLLQNIVGRRFGVARTRAGIYSEHAAAEEGKARILPITPDA